MAQEEATVRVLAAESGVQSLHNRLSKEEIARSEVPLKMEQAEAYVQQARARERPLSALHDEF